MRQKVEENICIQPPTPEPSEFGTQRPCPPSDAEQESNHASVPGKARCASCTARSHAREPGATRKSRKVWRSSHVS
jgi:hypothetical protein